jgi:hypothetical protein
LNAKLLEMWQWMAGFATPSSISQWRARTESRLELRIDCPTGGSCTAISHCQTGETVTDSASSGTGVRAGGFLPAAFFPLFQTCSATGQPAGDKLKKEK